MPTGHEAVAGNKAFATSDSLSLPGTGPQGIAWDGSRFWVTDWYGAYIFSVNPSDASVNNQFIVPSSVPREPAGVAWDGSNIWFVDGNALNSPGSFSLFKLNPVNGTVINQYTLSTLSGRDLTWDGTNFWYVDFDNATLNKITTSGSSLSQFTAPHPHPTSVEFANGSLYVCYSDYNVIDSVNPATGALQSSTTLPFGKTGASGIVWNGSSMWIISGTTLYKAVIPSLGPNGPIFSMPTQARMFGYSSTESGKSATLSRYMKNTGNTALVIDSLKLVEGVAGAFQLVSASPPITVLPGDSAQISIRFAPSDVLFYSGLVKIVSNTPTSPDSLYLGGEGSSTRMTFSGEAVHVHAGYYALLSIPYVLKDYGILSVLGSLGPYNIKSWRLFYWKNGYYIEYPKFAPADSLFFKPGVAFWLIARDSLKLTLQNISATPAVKYTGAFAIVANYQVRLQPGWNMIGDPFAYAVQWSGVLNTGQVQAPVVRNVVLNTFSYNQTVLEPWRGYFVYNRTTGPVVIEVPPFGSVPKSSGVRLLGKDEFVLQMQAEGIDSKWNTGQAAVGMLNSARDGIDTEDYLEAPPIGDYLQLSILDGRNRYAGNFKAVSDYGACWDFSLCTTGKKEMVEIALNGLSSLRKDFQIWLLDQDRDCLLPIQDGKTQLEAEDPGKAKRLRLIAGTEEFAERNNEGTPLVAYQFKLMPNFPNPFNPETHIEFHLAEKSDVALEIYNVLGQKVRTLIRGREETGVHHEVWDGKDDVGRSMNSGIYFCRIQTEKFTTTKKMILVR
jgi:hypothetical protein